MNRKMQGFLLSIGLEDVERFDMDFTLVAKDEYTPNQVNMMVEKESLWDYDLLDEFVMALGKIQYKYTIRFYYPNSTLSSKDVFDLLDRWYPRNYFMPIRFQADTFNPSKLDLVYSSDNERSQNMPRIKEFKDLLKLINYTMPIDQTVDPDRAKRIAEDAKRASKRLDVEEDSDIVEEVREPVVEELAVESSTPVFEETLEKSKPVEAVVNEKEAENEEDKEGEAYFSAEDAPDEEEKETQEGENLEEEEESFEDASEEEEQTEKLAEGEDEDSLKEEETIEEKAEPEGLPPYDFTPSFDSADSAPNVEDASPESVNPQPEIEPSEPVGQPTMEAEPEAEPEEAAEEGYEDDDYSAAEEVNEQFKAVALEEAVFTPSDSFEKEDPAIEETAKETVEEKENNVPSQLETNENNEVNEEETAQNPDENSKTLQNQPNFETTLEAEEAELDKELKEEIEEEEAEEAEECAEGEKSVEASADIEEEELVPVEEYEAPDEDDYDDDEESYANMNGEDSIAHDRAKSQEEGEAYLLAEMEQNLKDWEESKRRKALYKRGDYEVVDSIETLMTMTGVHNVDFEGVIFTAEPKLTKTGKQMNKIAVADDAGAISVIVFTSAQLKDSDVAGLVPGNRVRIRGAVDKDNFSGLPTVLCHYLNKLPPKELRKDPEPVKRVELHLHTKMSTMDGVSDMEDYVAVAKSMGMTAIAVTDHGSLQSLPACQEACGKAGLKPIYGVELYMVDPIQKVITNPSDIPLKNAKFCVFDTETTGLIPRFDRVVEFGGLIVQNGTTLKSWNTYINPRIPMTPGSSSVNHITDDMLVDKPYEEEVLPKILEMLEGCVLVAHNATFDIGFINAALERHGYPPLSNPVIDTLAISHYLFPEKASHKEEGLLKNLGLDVYSREDAHEAIYDATKLNEGWQVILAMLEEKKPGITHRDLADLNIYPPKEELKETDPEEYKKQSKIYNSYIGHLREKHATVLVKNAEGLRSVNRIISLAETTYLSGNPLLPRTPRGLLEQYRKNLLIGTACQNGEIFDLAQSESIEDLAKAISFYDFVEIQPLDCYSNLLNMGEIRNEDALKDILNSIIAAAKLAGKPVVATGDCHYVNPEDKIIRDIYICAKSIGNRSHPLWKNRRNKMPWFDNPNQHLRSTDEMIKEFSSWLGEDYAREIVVTNSNLIADQITTEPVPVSKDTFTPTQNIPHSEDILREMCEKNFQERYGGNPDPEVQARINEVHERLLQELDGIISHGYAVTYIIAHHLIRMAGEEPEHYIVGSRGSVGSSFAATMADITEVNALAPHYLCPKCHYFEWGDAKKYKSGFDLPDKDCPQCGTRLTTNGQNIPFQTFLGFSAEKVPDIDLNFEDESQKKAHNYTKILLGENKVFRAGTIETVAEKTAYGFVKSYYRIRYGEEGEKNVNPQWVNYLSSKVTGVKRTTGQHPGGIVVVPKQYDITDFTAYQHPADDRNSEWLTTHYDYHAMHDELLKLDILGHVDPMAMRYYRDITGVPIESIPMNDPRVLSLFTSPKELNLHENFLQLKTGVSAIPEFGTRMAQQMLTVAKPKTFNDLLIISGLAHGTDVWAGNAEDLIKSGTADINGVIGCRDDIMTYLISMGIDKSLSFNIMECVRKNKFRGKEEQFVPVMQAAHIPEWYIDSCRKIKYLFPRGHATAYVMMAVRVAWFKLYRPLEFYSVFFSIRSDAWDIKTMIEGEEAIKTRYTELDARRQSRDNPLSNKEADILKTLQIALEMVERGYSFAPIDFYKSDGKMFLPDHEHKCLIPPFSVIDGLGVAAGNSVVEARANGKPFLSKEDLLSRTKLSRTNVDNLIEIGGAEPLSEKNQMSLFDFFD